MGTAEDEMLDGITIPGHEFEQALRVGEGQGSLACCSPWGHKESDMTELPNGCQELLNILLFLIFVENVLNIITCQ